MENDVIDKAVDTYTAVKIIKTVAKAIAGIFTSFGFIIIVAVITGFMATDGTGAVANAFSSIVDKATSILP